MPSAAADFSPPPKEHRTDENLRSIPSGSSRSSSSSSSSGSSSNHHYNGSSTSGQASSSRSPGRRQTTAYADGGSSGSGGGGGTGKRNVSKPLPFETNDADALKLRIYTAPLQVEMPANLSLNKGSKTGGKGKLNAFDVQLETYSYPTWERCKVQVAAH